MKEKKEEVENRRGGIGINFISSTRAAENRTQ